MAMTILGTTRARRTLLCAVTLLSGLLDPLPLPATGSPSTKLQACGFHRVNPDHHNGAIALYDHCANSFILIRVDAAGSSRHRCVEPWGSVRFWPHEHVRNAYYVRVAPRLLTTSDGSLICSLSQPPV